GPLPPAAAQHPSRTLAWSGSPGRSPGPPARTGPPGGAAHRTPTSAGQRSPGGASPEQPPSRTRRPWAGRAQRPSRAGSPLRGPGAGVDLPALEVPRPPLPPALRGPRATRTPRRRPVGAADPRRLGPRLHRSDLGGGGVLPGRLRRDPVRARSVGLALLRRLL